MLLRALIWLHCVKAGINFEVDHKAIYRPKEIAKFSAYSRLNIDVVLLRMFPSIRTETVEHFMKPPIQGVVLQVKRNLIIP